MDGVQKLIVAGAGPQFWAQYADVLENVQTAAIALVVDIKSQEEKVKRALAQRNMAPELLFLPEEWRVDVPQRELEAKLDHAQRTIKADAIAICAEPKAHMAFALWACARGLAIFLNKPISAFTSFQRRHQLYEDYRKLAALQERSRSRIVIACERRIHSGYEFFFSFLSDFMIKYGTPITSINVHFGAGNLVMQPEYEGKESHPFKYGYGVLLHSGYHYIDLVARTAALNRMLDGQHTDRIPVVRALFSRSLSARGLPTTIKFGHHAANCDYEPPNFRPVPSPSSEPGEVDVLASGYYPGVTPLLFSMQLLGNTVSAREDFRIAEGNIIPNRVRQESVLLHIGNWCSLNVSSFDYAKLDPEFCGSDFVVTVAVNPVLAEGPAVQVIDRFGLQRRFPDCPASGSLNKWYGQMMFSKFIEGSDCNSSLQTHLDTVILLQELYSTADTVLPRSVTTKSSRGEARAISER